MFAVASAPSPVRTQLRTLHERHPNHLGGSAEEGKARYVSPSKQAHNQVSLFKQVATKPTKASAHAQQALKAVQKAQAEHDSGACNEPHVVQDLKRDDRVKCGADMVPEREMWRLLPKLASLSKLAVLVPPVTAAQRVTSEIAGQHAGQHPEQRKRPQQEKQQQQHRQQQEKEPSGVQHAQQQQEQLQQQKQQLQEQPKLQQEQHHHQNQHHHRLRQQQQSNPEQNEQPDQHLELMQQQPRSGPALEKQLAESGSKRLLAFRVTANNARRPTKLRRYTALEQVLCKRELQNESGVPRQEQGALDARASSFRARLRRERRKHSWNSIPLSFFVDGEVLEARGSNGRSVLVPKPSRDRVEPAPGPAAAALSARQEQHASQQSIRPPRSSRQLEQTSPEHVEQHIDVRCNAWSLIVSLLTFGFCSVS
jgi:hypothetical protein